MLKNRRAVLLARRGAAAGAQVEEVCGLGELAEELRVRRDQLVGRSVKRPCACEHRRGLRSPRSLRLLVHRQARELHRCWRERRVKSAWREPARCVKCLGRSMSRAVTWSADVVFCPDLPNRL